MNILKKLLVATFCSFFLTGIVLARGSVGGFPLANSDSSYPGWFVYDLAPGQSKTDVVVVKNTTSRNVIVDIYGADRTPSTAGGFALKQKAESMSGIGAWIKISQSQVSLASGEKKQVPFTITIPANVSDAKLAGGIVIQEIKPANKATGGITLSTRSGIRVYNTDPGIFNKKLLANAPVAKPTVAPTVLKADLLAHEPKKEVVPVPSDPGILEIADIEKMLVLEDPTGKTDLAVEVELLNDNLDEEKAEGSPRDRVSVEEMQLRMAEFRGIAVQQLKADLAAAGDDPFDTPAIKKQEEEIKRAMESQKKPKVVTEPSSEVNIFSVIKNVLSSLFW